MNGKDRLVRVEIRRLIRKRITKALKIYPLQNRSPEEGAKFVSYVRNLIGSETPLMLDLASPDNAKLAYELAPLVAPFNSYWYEEPVDGENTRTLADIRSKTGLRIVTGEKQCGLPHFEETLAANAADILNPDIAAVGGILDMIKISEWSLKKDVKVSPHCWNSMSIAAAAMLHFHCWHSRSWRHGHKSRYGATLCTGELTGV